MVCTYGLQDALPATTGMPDPMSAVCQYPNQVVGSQQMRTEPAGLSVIAPWCSRSRCHHDGAIIVMESKTHP